MRDSTETSTPGVVAVHMAALRGNADSTHVLYWYHGFDAHLMLNATDSTHARHVNVRTGQGTEPDYVESFCGGHSTLADGRLGVFGGGFGATGDAQSGSRFAELFDPKQYGNATRGWVKPDSMPSNRWYPTCISLFDGSILVVQGDDHYQMMMYGGVDSNDVAQNDLRTYAITSATPFWRGEQVIASPGTQYTRTGHSAVNLGGEESAMFGGIKANGEYLDNLQFTYREDYSDIGQRWQLYDPGASGTPPSKRWKHAGAEIIFTPARTGLGDKAMIILGGQDLSATLKNDVHELFYRYSTLRWEWTELLPTGDAPSPRLGHVAVYDRVPPNGSADSTRLLVFGGRDANGLADNAVYALRLGTNPPSWYVAVAANADTNAAPSKREGHAAIFDPAAHPLIGPNQKQQMVLFGGRDSAGALLNDAWVLQRDKTGTIYSWKKLNPAGRPAVRMDHAAIYEDKRQLMLIVGGDGNGLTSGGQRDDVWGLPLGATQSADSAWRQMPSMGSLGPRAGQVVAFIPLKPVKNRVIQRFVPTAAAGEQWKTLHWAPKLMPSTYPFMFVLPNGYVAWVGPNVSTGCAGCSNDTTMLLNPDSTAANRGWQPPPSRWSNQSFWGGAAVMYSAGSDSVKILKCGGNFDYVGQSPLSYVIAFSANGGSGGWRGVAAGSGALSTRKSHNLTLLPTGEVLVTGGRGIATKSKPQIWNPVTGLWSAELAEEPRVRNRHSTAVLMPDGRVLSAGGSNESATDLQDSFWGTVYEPPYLFDSNGAYVTRAALTCSPSRVKFGQLFTVACDSAQTIDRVGMIRPGATTHGFDQNQRYVPVSFVRASNPSRLLVTAPANGHLAPPGDYYVFACDSIGGRSIPSVAKWVTVGSTWVIDACDAIRPEPVTDLLACTVSAGTIQLTWTAPADDSALAVSGPVQQYDLRKSLVLITDANWNLATPVATNAPGAPGSAEALTLSGMGSSTWYFRMKSLDDHDHWSGLSNQAAAGPLILCDGGDGMFGGSGGGGGGGLRARRAVGASSGEQVTPEAYVENSLLDGALAGENASDVCRLAVPPAVEQGAYRVRLRQTGTLPTALDAARLRVVDHAPGVTAYSIRGDVVLGTRVAAVRVTAADGTDLTAALDAGGEVTVAAGDTLTVQLDAEGGGSPSDSTLVVLDAARVIGERGASPCMILAQAPDATGEWQTLDQRSPRRAFDELVMGPVVGHSLRLLFLGEGRLRFVGRLAPASASPTLQWASLLAVESSRHGDITSVVGTPDADRVTLAGPDTLVLGYSIPPQEAGQVREYFLAVDATLSASKSLPGMQSNTRVPLPVVPAQFALRQNQPNPFRGTTAIRFELPVGAMVRLEIFDVQGRRLQMLANRYYPAGYHAVRWDQRTSSGAIAGPGVYFYRIEASTFRDRKKTILLP